MKVIGLTKEGYNAKYICEVSHTEIEKFMGLYYNKLKSLKVGEEIDLGKGHDFARESKRALEETEAFIKANAKIVRLITEGISIFKLAEAPDEEALNDEPRKD